MEVETLALTNLEYTHGFSSGTDQDFSSPLFNCHFPLETVDFKGYNTETLPSESNPNSSPSPSQHPMGNTPMVANEGGERREEVEQELKITSADRQEGIDIVANELQVDSAIVDNEDVEGGAEEEQELKITSADRQDGIDVELFGGSEYTAAIKFQADSAIVANEDVEGGAEEEQELKITSADRQEGIDMEFFGGSEYTAAIKFQADSAIVANEDAEGAEENLLTEEFKIASSDRKEGIDIEPFVGSECKAAIKLKADSAIVVKEDAEGAEEENLLTEEFKIASSDRKEGIDIELLNSSNYKVAIKLKADSSILANEDVEGGANEEHLFIEEFKIASLDRQDGIDMNPFGGSEYKAAIKLQKFYKSYRTRRRLADSAIVAEELWWQARDFARLNHTTVSFFNYSKPETAITRWNRVSINASKVGQGLSKDGKALKLAFQHWIEAIDPRHRYGHNLHFYYEKWCESETDQPFFYWLDLGEGKNLELEECPRSLLRQQCIKYLGPHERERYEYVLAESRIRHKQTGDLLDTTKEPEGAKWIFVMSTSRRLYAGRKKRGMFQHSSFLAGGTTIAAGRLTAENGVLKAIWAYSGHYRPTTDNLKQFIEYLRENGADLNLVQIRASGNEDYNEDNAENPQSQTEKSLDGAAPALKLPPLRIPAVNFAPPDKPVESSIDNKSEIKGGVYRRTFSGGLQSPAAGVPENAIHERIKSKRESGSYQLGHQVSSNWCSGVGARIGCVADYPLELRLQALEFTNLSPRTTPTHSFCSPSVLSPFSTGDS